MATQNTGAERCLAYSPAVPPTQSSTPPAAPLQQEERKSEDLEGTAEVDYLNQVMAEIDAEVRRRRASGDLPAGLERELDELFLEFSPIGLQGKARLRETLALVDGSAYVDTAVPTASQKALGGMVKRTIRKALGWYIGFIVHQVVKFAWAVSRMFHVLVDHVEDLEAAVESQRRPALPPSAVPQVDPGAQWWSPLALSALADARGRVLHAECGAGGLLDGLLAAGVDAYGVDPAESNAEIAADRGLDVRAEAILDHLAVVAEEALAGLVLSGSVQWLDPGERRRLIEMVSSRLALGGVLVVHSTTPEAWAREAAHVLSDLAPGRPLHPETWAHLLAEHGFGETKVTFGGGDSRLERIADRGEQAAAVNAAIDVVNALLLGPAEYVLVAVRER